MPFSIMVWPIIFSHTLEINFYLGQVILTDNLISILIAYFFIIKK